MSARIARNRWLATLLALAMLCAQAMALRHAVQHHLDAGAAASTLSANAGGTQGVKHGLGGSDTCLKCLAIQQLASALPATDFRFDAASHQPHAAPAGDPRVAFHVRVGPPARGPPLVS